MVKREINVGLTVAGPAITVKSVKSSKAVYDHPALPALEFPSSKAMRLKRVCSAREREGFTIPFVQTLSALPFSLGFGVAAASIGLVTNRSF